MASQTELQILIRTIADSQGITLTNEQLDKTVEKVGKLQEATEQQTAAESAQKAEQHERAEEALRQIDAEEKTAAAAKKTKKETESLSKSMRDLRESGRGADEILQGLERGGLGGLTQAARGSFNLLKGLSAGFAELGIAGAAALPILAAGSAALFLLRQRGEEMARDNQKSLDEAGKAWQRYQRLVSEASAAIEADFKKQSEAIDQLTENLNNRFDQIGKAEERNKRLSASGNDLANARRDSAEKAALAGASTPEQKARISSDFARQKESDEISQTVSGFDNTELNAQTRIRAAQEELTNIRGQRRDQQQTLSDAERHAEETKGVAASFAPDDTSAVAADARKEALAAREALKTAQEKAGDLDKKLAPDEKRAQEEIDAAKATLQETSDRRAAYKALIEGKASEDKAALNADQQGLNKGADDIAKKQAEIDATKSSDATSLEFNKHTDTSKAEAQLSNMRAAQEKSNAVLIDHAVQTKKLLDVHQAAIKKLTNDSKVQAEQMTGG
jgi:hypothetical protein